MSVDAAALPIYVLIGGESRRFGRDKATEPIDGVPWAMDVGRRLSGGKEFTLVGTSRAGGGLSTVRRIDDALPDEGPLCGILAAIRDRNSRFGSGWMVIASCDLVQADRAWLTPLVAECRNDVHVIAYHVAGRWQPFPALVHTSWEAELAIALRGGVRSIQQAFADAASHAASWPGTGDGPPQANTPEELARRRS